MSVGEVVGSFGGGGNGPGQGGSYLPGCKEGGSAGGERWGESGLTPDGVRESLGVEVLLWLG